MKKISILGMGLLVGCLGIQSHAATVYEGFDYTLGDDIVGLGGASNGWDGAWIGTDNNAAGTPHVGAGLSLGALEEVGGAYRRPARNGYAQSSRQITAASQAALTADDATIWFSVLMTRTFGGAEGFTANTHGAIVFGDTAFTTGDSSYNPPVNAGSAFGVSYDGVNGSSTNWINGVTYNNGARTVGSADKIQVDGDIVLIVGKIDWAANGTNDTMSLYRVSDPTAALPAAFTTMSADIDQSGFNLVAIGQGQTEVFDEIRFDTTLEGVLAVGEPSSEVLWVDILSAGTVQEGFQSGFSVVNTDRIVALTNSYAADARTSSGNVDVTLEASTYLAQYTSRPNFPTNGIVEGFTYEDLYKDVMSAGSATGYLTLTLSGLNTNQAYTLTLYALNSGSSLTDEKEWSVVTGTPAPQMQSVNFTDPVLDNDSFAMEFIVTSTSNGVIAVQNTAGLQESVMNGFKLSIDLAADTGDTEIISITQVDADTFRVECALEGNGPSDVAPVTTDALTGGSWSYIAHSDDGVNSFIVTNLDYSTVSGSNVVFYVEGTNSVGFFGLE